MSPRRGGEADKLGNRYELTWAVRHAILCLRHGGVSLTVEDIDADLSKGSEFTYSSGSTTEVHQVKRQRSGSNYWSVTALASAGVLASAVHHVTAGRRFRFCSLLPCGPLSEMADKARRSQSVEEFTTKWLIEAERPAFEQLAAEDAVGGAVAAWTLLRGVSFEVHDESDVDQMNAVLAELMLTGGTGSLMCLALGKVVLDNLGVPLTREGLLDHLAGEGIRPLPVVVQQTVGARVRELTSTWRAAVQRELLSPEIERAEAGGALEALEDHQTVVVVGGAGSGKSAVLHQAVVALQAAGTEVLAVRLDRVEPFHSTSDLGRQLELGLSPAAALSLTAADRDAVLVVDQVDAVSLASGRMPDSFDTVVDLLAEASALGIRVLLVSRRFDLENDQRLRALAADESVGRVDVGLLTDEAVGAAVQRMGLDPGRLTAQQRTLLRTPLHLVLFASVSTEAVALDFRTAGSLFDAFYEHKRRAVSRRRQGVRFGEVVRRVAVAASERQALSIPVAVLDGDDLADDADVLVSEHVLARLGNRIGFFHETFFDYAFARYWGAEGGSLLEFLLSGEQELFRRGQVRQVLSHLREVDPERFLADVEATLTSAAVRFHIKATVLAVLGSLEDPTVDEGAAVLGLATEDAEVGRHLWRALRGPQWFRRFFDDGWVGAWLDSSAPDERERALDLMGGGAASQPSCVTALLQRHRDHPDYSTWLRWVVRFADIAQHRPLFDLLLDAVRAGAYSEHEHLLWLSAYDLGDDQPAWGLELLAARVAAPSDVADRSLGRDSVLLLNEHGACELVRKGAAADPRTFVSTFLPYVLAVADRSAPEDASGRLRRDEHFAVRFPAPRHRPEELGHALFEAMYLALESLVIAAPDEVRPVLDDLADSRLWSAQFLLYKALTAGAESQAERAAELLLERPDRLDCGYVSDRHWVARELVVRAAPHVSAATHGKLEDAFRDLRPATTGHRWSGYTAFAFLSALQEGRLSALGRRRLQEYRRKFEQGQPAPPAGVEGGVVPSPIDEQGARLMSDDQWFGAMRRYTGGEPYEPSLTGGVHQLSQVLRRRVTEDPRRFAALALRLTEDVDPSYAEAVLMGLGDASAGDVEGEAVFGAVRHIASLGHPSNDRWLGSALRTRYEQVPQDLVQLLVDRARQSSDPADDTPVISSRGPDGREVVDLFTNGINTGRGAVAEELSRVLWRDVDGARTALVRPIFVRLSSDPVLSVRCCVARVLTASLRHERAAVIEAFEVLIDADDRLLATDPLQQLMARIGDVDPGVIDPVIKRMLVSLDDQVRRAGGGLSVYAALEWSRSTLMERVLTSDAATRSGAAEVCSGLFTTTSDAALAAGALTRFFHDSDPGVRRTAAGVPTELRGAPLSSHRELLADLIASPAFSDAVTQLLITLRDAPDRTDALVELTARRFVEVFGEEAGNITTASAGDALHIGELVVRGLAQCRDVRRRASLLDVLDDLLESGAYGMDRALAEQERA